MIIIGSVLSRTLKYFVIIESLFTFVISPVLRITFLPSLFWSRRKLRLKSSNCLKFLRLWYSSKTFFAFSEDAKISKSSHVEKARSKLDHFVRKRVAWSLSISSMIFSGSKNSFDSGLKASSAFFPLFNSSISSCVIHLAKFGGFEKPARKISKELSTSFLFAMMKPTETSLISSK